jgi:EAL domain-containing protein (putative c-di-GMP-specific phosphodiesterase class I)
MGKKTTAEYVETGEALAVLQDIGVDYVQGYSLGAPAPLEQLGTETERQDSTIIYLQR